MDHWMRHSTVVEVMRGADTGFVAVNTPRGPHVTPQRVVESDGRLWFTTSRSARKITALEDDAAAGVMVHFEGASACFAGDVLLVDPLNPLSVSMPTLDGLRAARAAARLLTRQGQDFAGYLASGVRVPWRWLPASRVLVGVRPDRVLVNDRRGNVVYRAGVWRHRGDAVKPMDRKPGVITPLGGEAGRQLLREGFGALALGGGRVPVVAWGRWNRNTSCVRLRSAIVSCLSDSQVPAAFVVSSSSGFRPVDKSGTLLRGIATLVEVGDKYSEVLFDIETVTRWDGFDVATVSA